MTREQRKERTPVSGARDILSIKNKDPNYEYRFVLDLPGRVQRFNDGGWEIVTDDLTVGQTVVDRGTKVGSAVTKHAGGNQTYILMRISKEWYDEDQIAKQDKVDSLEQTMMKDIAQGRFPASGSHDVGSYVPDGGGIKTSITVSKPSK